MTATPYQFLPPLTDEEREALRESIATFGVLQPVIVDEVGAIIDGHHRAVIADELGIPYERTVLAGLSEEQKVEQALALNLGRRHLTLDQRTVLVTDLRSRGFSIRWISEASGIPRSTVQRIASGVPDGTPEYVSGKDGKAYRARTPVRDAQLREIERGIDIQLEDAFSDLACVYWGSPNGPELVRQHVLPTFVAHLVERGIPDHLVQAMRGIWERWIDAYDEDRADPPTSVDLADWPIDDVERYYRGCWRLSHPDGPSVEEVVQGLAGWISKHPSTVEGAA